MKNLKLILAAFTFLLFSVHGYSQVKTIPNSFLGCWYSGPKVNPQSKNQIDRFPAVYIELKSQSLTVISLEDGKESLVELTCNSVELVGAIVPIGLIKMFFGQLDIH